MHPCGFLRDKEVASGAGPPFWNWHKGFHRMKFVWWKDSNPLPPPPSAVPCRMHRIQFPECLAKLQSRRYSAPMPDASGRARSTLDALSAGAAAAVVARRH
jgi:hypothetical protein